MTADLWEWALSASALIAVVLILRGLLGRRISAGLRYGLWAVVLIRLLIPVSVSALSVTVPQLPKWTPPDAMQEESIYVLPVDISPLEKSGVWVNEDGELGNPSSFGYPRLTGDGERVVRYADRITPLDLLKWGWIAGAAAMGIVLLVSNLRFSRRLRRVRRPLDGTAAPVPMYVAPALPSPCLVGLFFPAVYVTEEAAADPVMLRHVLAHELTHYNHRDHLWSVLRGAALAVHWWNPLVWLAVVCSRRDGELACDEGALKQLGDEERTAYGETLLALVTAKSRPGDLFSFATTMSGGKRSLRERIQRIAGQPKTLVSAVVVAVAVLALSTVIAFGHAKDNDASVDLTQKPTFAVEPSGNLQRQQIGDNGPSPSSFENRKEGVYTFLLAGTDAGGCNMDTIMLVTYDSKNQNVSIMSIPRDTIVNDGQTINKIGYTYSKGTDSMDILKEEVRALVGFIPDYYVKADLAMFVRLVDLLGGVKFDVPQDMDYDDLNQDLHIHLKKGVQTLNGEQAMGLVRFRRYTEGDIQRITVQQDFIKALLKECLSIKNWGDITACINLVLENVDTDLDIGSAAWFAANMLGQNIGISALSVEDVYTCTMPGDYWGTMTLGQHDKPQTVVTSYPEQVAELINDRFNPYEDDITVVASMHHSQQAAGASEPSQFPQMDLDHDGKPDELLLQSEPDPLGYSYDGTRWTLQCSLSGGTWEIEGMPSLPGENAVFLYRMDGEDYLLVYTPNFWHGQGYYDYRLIWLDGGREVVVQENSVDFDARFREDSVFEPERIAAFMDEVNALLSGSIQLVNTNIYLQQVFDDEGRLYDRLYWLDNTREDDLSLLENLQNYAAYSQDHPDDTWSPLADLLEDLSEEDIPMFNGDTSALVRMLQAGERGSRFYTWSSEADAYLGHGADEVDYTIWNIPLADGNTLWLMACEERASVLVMLETQDGTYSAFYDAPELRDAIIEDDTDTN